MFTDGPPAELLADVKRQVLRPMRLSLVTVGHFFAGVLDQRLDEHEDRDEEEHGRDRQDQQRHDTVEDVVVRLLEGCAVRHGLGVRYVVREADHQLDDRDADHAARESPDGDAADFADPAGQEEVHADHAHDQHHDEAGDDMVDPAGGDGQVDEVPAEADSETGLNEAPAGGRNGHRADAPTATTTVTTATALGGSVSVISHENLH